MMGGPGRQKVEASATERGATLVCRENSKRMLRTSRSRIGKWEFVNLMATALATLASEILLHLTSGPHLLPDAAEVGSEWCQA
jgi:hypothetical protein